MIEILPLLTPEVIERFWAKVLVINDEDSCWEWTAVKTGWGYGSQTIKNRQIGSHRISWVMANNQEIPEGLSVLHRCDNPACVRPSHLFVGTQKDNMQDKARKGRCVNNLWRDKAKSLERLRSGKNVKIRKEQVPVIRSRFDKMKLHMEPNSAKDILAAELGVTRQCITLIINRRTWKDI